MATLLDQDVSRTLHMQQYLSEREFLLRGLTEGQTVEPGVFVQRFLTKRSLSLPTKRLPFHRISRYWRGLGKLCDEERFIDAMLLAEINFQMLVRVFVETQWYLFHVHNFYIGFGNKRFSEPRALVGHIFQLVRRQKKAWESGFAFVAAADYIPYTAAHLLNDTPPYGTK